MEDREWGNVRDTSRRGLAGPVTADAIMQQLKQCRGSTRVGPWPQATTGIGTLGVGPSVDKRFDNELSDRQLENISKKVYKRLQNKMAGGDSMRHNQNTTPNAPPAWYDPGDNVTQAMHNPIQNIEESVLRNSKQLVKENYQKQPGTGGQHNTELTAQHLGIMGRHAADTQVEAVRDEARFVQKEEGNVNGKNLHEIPKGKAETEESMQKQHNLSLETQLWQLQQLLIDSEGERKSLEKKYSDLSSIFNSCTETYNKELSNARDRIIDLQKERHVLISNMHSLKDELSQQKLLIKDGEKAKEVMNTERRESVSKLMRIMSIINNSKNIDKASESPVHELLGQIEQNVLKMQKKISDFEDKQQTNNKNDDKFKNTIEELNNGIHQREILIQQHLEKITALTDKCETLIGEKEQVSQDMAKIAAEVTRKERKCMEMRQVIDNKQSFLRYVLTTLVTQIEPTHKNKEVSYSLLLQAWGKLILEFYDVRKMIVEAVRSNDINVLIAKAKASQERGNKENKYFALSKAVKDLVLISEEDMSDRIQQFSNEFTYLKSVLEKTILEKEQAKERFLSAFQELTDFLGKWKDDGREENVATLSTEVTVGVAKLSLGEAIFNISSFMCGDKYEELLEINYFRKLTCALLNVLSKVVCGAKCEGALTDGVEETQMKELANFNKDLLEFGGHSAIQSLLSGISNELIEKKEASTSLSIKYQQLSQYLQNLSQTVTLEIKDHEDLLNTLEQDSRTCKSQVVTMCDELKEIVDKNKNIFQTPSTSSTIENLPLKNISGSSSRRISDANESENAAGKELCTSKSSSLPTSREGSHSLGGSSSKYTSASMNNNQLEHEVHALKAENNILQEKTTMMGKSVNYVNKHLCHLLDLKEIRNQPIKNLIQQVLRCNEQLAKTLIKKCNQIQMLTSHLSTVESIREEELEKYKELKDKFEELSVKIVDLYPV